MATWISMIMSNLEFDGMSWRTMQMWKTEEAGKDQNLKYLNHPSGRKIQLGHLPCILYMVTIYESVCEKRWWKCVHIFSTNIYSSSKCYTSEEWYILQNEERPIKAKTNSCILILS